VNTSTHSTPGRRPPRRWARWLALLGGLAAITGIGATAAEIGAYY
jgi:hypothetical protein